MKLHQFIPFFLVIATSLFADCRTSSIPLDYSTTPVPVVRVVPISYHEECKEWKVLVSHNPRAAVWEDVSGMFPFNAHPYGAAEAILKRGTGCLYNLKLAGQPYLKVKNCENNNDEFVFYVPVKYIEASYLNHHGKNGFRNRFVWMGADELMHLNVDPSSHFIKCKDCDYLSYGFVELFQCTWPVFKKELVRHPDAPIPSEVVITDTSNLSWYDINCAVLFEKLRSQYGFFSNFYPSKFELDGKTWPTVVHYYEAMKFLDQPDIQYVIRKQPTPRDAIDIANGKEPEIRGEIRPDWDEVKAQVMLRAVRAKFRQNPYLCRCLSYTYGNIIVFDTSRSFAIDRYWGAGPDGQGRNVLGQILMQVRYEINHDHGPCTAFVEQPLRNFTNGLYFAPPSIIECHPQVCSAR